MDPPLMQDRTIIPLSQGLSPSVSIPTTVQAAKMTMPAAAAAISTVAVSSSETDIEAAKKCAARLAVREHFPQNPSFVGIGSGSTIKYVVDAIKELNLPNESHIQFVPTGYQSRQVITGAGLRDIKFDSIPRGRLIDIAFDGADEVDEDLNCIKGGGACLYQEKLVATQAKKFICVADHRKLQPRLLTTWPSVPIEVEPLAEKRVLAALELLGSREPRLRQGHMSKAGPLKTDQDNFIIDAPFKSLVLPSDIQRAKDEGRVIPGNGQNGIWEVMSLALAIKALEGVLSVGIFSGVNGLQAASLGDGTGGQKPVSAYFGMADGSVVVRVADAEGNVVLREQKG